MGKDTVTYIKKHDFIETFDVTFTFILVIYSSLEREIKKPMLRLSCNNDRENI